jgi:outer membrane protein
MHSYRVPQLFAILLLMSAQPALADAGDFLFKARAIYVKQSNSMVALDPGLAVGPLTTDDMIGAEFSATYFWTDQIGLEFSLGGGKTNFPAADSAIARGELVSASVVAPAIVLQFHPLPKASIRPYVGFGVNYTLFYDEKPGVVLLNKAILSGASATAAVALEGKFGYLAQIGIDLPVNDRFFINFDLKYIKSSTTLTVKTNGTDFVDIKLDPFVFGVGLGFRF